MKMIFLSVLLLLFASIKSHSQNTGIGTTSPQFKLDVRNGSINTDSVYRIGGNAVISVKGTENTLIGIGPHDALNAGAYNTAIGAKALAGNNGGCCNTAVGVEALYENTTGGGNTAIGIRAMHKNASGVENTAIGLHSLYSNWTGNYNTAMGPYALSQNTGSSHSVAFGRSALEQNRRSYNAAFGSLALSNTEYSEYNVGVGYKAGDYYDHGYNNVFVGANTNTNGDGYYNVIAIGQGTLVGGSSRAVFGNPATVFYGGWATWSSFSDGRFKKNVKENVPGLAFINRLRPVTYNLEAASLDAFLHQKIEIKRSAEATAIHAKALQEKEAVAYTGFIAQEVEGVAKQLGFAFSGVEPAKNANDTYSLRYAEFVVPLVKAVQEQQAMIEKQAQAIELIRNENATLKKRLETIEKLVVNKE
jgi:trimeric autotransporter adhesin